MFRRKIGIVLAIMLTFSLMGYVLIMLFGRTKQNIQQEEYLVATTFYPVYVLTKNLTEGAQNVRVVNLTENHTGCVHDYQLTTGDMRTLSHADLLVENGGEMELFLQQAAERFPELCIVDSSEGMKFIEGEIHHHHGAEEEEPGGEDEIHEQEDELHEHEHEHGTGINGHVWMNPSRYLRQIDRVCDALCRMDSAQEMLYRKNASDYRAEVEEYVLKYQQEAERLEGLEVILFHDAFYYLSEICGFEVLHSVDLDADTALSAGEIAQLTDEIRLHGVKYLLAEEETGAIAKQLATETGCSVIYLESGTSGSAQADAYLHTLEYNLEKLRGMEP